MKSWREWRISLSRLTLVVAAGSGIALFVLATLDVFKPLKSTRAVLNVESACALAIVILTFLCVNENVSPKRTQRLSPGLFAILLGTLVTACYWPSLSIGFLSDDFISVKYANTLTGDQVLGTFLHPSGGSFFRPLEYVSLRATGPWAGFDPIRWHAANMLVHFTNSVLVYSVAARLYQGFWTPAMASLLFAVHGTRPEAVAWVNGRLDLITAFFFLLALLLYLRYCETPRASLLAASLVSVSCAVMTKESAYVFPLILLLIAWFKKDRAFRRPAVHLPFWLLTVAVFAYRWSLLGGIGGYRGPVTGKPEILQMGVIGWVKAMVLRVWAILYFPIN
ncbi:MAG: rane protein of unknown function, partial [Bryobacterales bacterium]|nr:rane protein of unknown function [Bryobacterales bacterium]